MLDFASRGTGRFSGPYFDISAEQPGVFLLSILNRKLKKLMLVEDDAFDSLVIKRALKLLKSDVLLDWQQESWIAIEKLAKLSEEELPDLILLDIRMPRLDGFQFLRELKANKLLNKIPVVVVSTSNDDTDIKKALSLGASKYVVKSFDFNEFVADLKTIDGIA